MSISRRDFLLATASLALAGCRGRLETSTTEEDSQRRHMLNHAGGNRQPRVLNYGAPLAKAAAFLASEQSADGAWRSDLVGTFKDGTALTPLVLLALLHAAAKNAAIPKAAQWLADMAKPDGAITAPEAHGFDYPVYTAALTVSALSHAKCPPHPKARDAWLKFLRERQLTEALGWQPADREFGGWGYAHGIPRKPKSGELIPPLTESNLSATTFALAALTAAKIPANDPAFAKSLVFVKRCQNWNDDVNDNLNADDGGFYFIYDDPVRNKAGRSGKDDRGRERFQSYGSMTADGLRCLQMCGLANHDRAAAASAWLHHSFKADRVPGYYATAPKFDRQSEYFYYAASIAQCDKQLDVNVPDAPMSGREALAEALKAKQKADGSWANSADASREHEPLVATSFACIALAHCQGELPVFLSD
jgi:hypothetical protein